VNELHVVVIVSQVPENVCKQSRKTVIMYTPPIYLESIMMCIAWMIKLECFCSAMSVM